MDHTGAASSVEPRSGRGGIRGGRISDIVAHARASLKEPSRPFTPASLDERAANQLDGALSRALDREISRASSAASNASRRRSEPDIWVNDAYNNDEDNNSGICSNNEFESDEGSRGGSMHDLLAQNLRNSLQSKRGNQSNNQSSSNGNNNYYNNSSDGGFSDGSVNRASYENQNHQNYLEKEGGSESGKRATPSFSADDDACNMNMNEFADLSVFSNGIGNFSMYSRSDSVPGAVDLYEDPNSGNDSNTANGGGSLQLTMCDLKDAVATLDSLIGGGGSAGSGSEEVLQTLQGITQPVDALAKYLTEDFKQGQVQGQVRSNSNNSIGNSTNISQYGGHNVKRSPNADEMVDTAKDLSRICTLVIRTGASRKGQNQAQSRGSAKNTHMYVG